MSRKHFNTRNMILTLVAILLVGFALFITRWVNTPDLLSYSRSPNDLVIYADEQIHAGAPEPGEMCNHIPNLRIWGDGRLVYVNYDYQAGGRTVYTGHLDSDQIAAALDLLKNRGFFVPVTPEPANPSGTFFVLRVNLAADQENSTLRSNKSYFTALVDSFNLNHFTLFVPSEALLVTSSRYVERNPTEEWPARFGFSLGEADQGKWIRGDVLDYLWQFVNEWRGVVPTLRENGITYSIALEIPGISALDPPFDCWGSLKSIVTLTPTP